MGEPDLVYVYGVSSTPRGQRVVAEGIEGSGIHPVEHAGLVALTSRLERRSLTPKDLRAHWRVLERAFAEGTVLPLRFGTVLESEDAVRERLLAANAERLSTLLSELAGLVQLNVKGRYQEEVLLREIVGGSQAIGELRERLRALPAGVAPAEQLRLGQLVEAEIEGRRLEDAAAALDALESLAVAAREDEAAYPAAFNLAFLVREGEEARFSKAVAELVTRLGERVRIRYVGPIPPFSFADTDLSSGSGAWA